MMSQLHKRPQCQFAAQPFPPRLGFACVLSRMVLSYLVPRQDQMPPSAVHWEVDYYLKSFFSSQGAKIIQSFMWYLNPRQVFDLSQGGPKEA